ncbi:MAG TPA: flagellar assembly protein FliW [Bryobacterales bacterium]|nr:flagellar assembly protein FliW [Bryobacterales bacterium]
MAENDSWPKGVVHFPEGLPGFEDLTRFVLLQDEELLPIAFLSSLIEPKVCFPVLPIQRIDQNYELRLRDDDRQLLKLNGEPVDGINILCVAILNLGDGSKPPSANLFAPIVINLENWTAKQIIQFESSYSSVSEV